MYGKVRLKLLNFNISLFCKMYVIEIKYDAIISVVTLVAKDEILKQILFL